MKDAAAPIQTDLVLLGGGHTHAIVLRKLGMCRLPGVQLTLITNLIDTPYSGMLPCHIAGRYRFDESHIDLRPLTRFANSRLIMDTAIELDLEHRQVICANHPPIAYDLLSIDTGSTPKMAMVPGAADYAIPAKPVPQLLAAWQAMLAQVQANPQQPFTLGIVGAGVGGVELALNMQERLLGLFTAAGQPPEKLTMHVFHRGEAVATGRNRATQRRLQQIFRQRGIHLHLKETVAALQLAEDGDTRVVTCESGLAVRCDRVIWVTSSTAPDWVRQSGLATDAEGFIQVRDTLQSCSHDTVFAAGDIATMVNHPRPKAGVFAVRQGKPLFDNLLRALQGQPLQPFRPQKEFLNLIDVGYGKAIASRNFFSVESSLCRWWKDRIDRKFMRLFTEFPDPETMSPKTIAPKEPGVSPMYCAGCGAKVGSDALATALARVQVDFPTSADWPAVQDVVIGLSDPDDAAVVRVPPGQRMVHTVDQFPALLDDPFLFAQIAAHHCLSDLYAMGARPHTVLALVTVPYATPAKQADLLYLLLSGVQKVLGQAQVPLVGGHTTQGESLSLGFACNGLVQPDQILRKKGLQPGNRLILTKPIGTGTLFAADMQKQAKGRWIEAAVQSMLQSNQAAAHCLREHGATACTDVTGFGLLGHLLEMVQASEVSVALDLSALPILAGARETVAQGFLSSLHPENVRAATAIQNRHGYDQHPDWPLLFDPQTAGGLLATVPAAQMDLCLQALHQLGYGAAVALGEVLPLEHPTQPIKIEGW